MVVGSEGRDTTRMRLQDFRGSTGLIGRKRKSHSRKGKMGWWKKIESHNKKKKKGWQRERVTTISQF